jgi:hypothetical protein
MSFHRSGSYGINMGLDADNVFRVGGWVDGVGVYRFTSTSTGAFTIPGLLTSAGVTSSGVVTANAGVNSTFASLTGNLTVDGTTNLNGATYTQGLETTGDHRINGDLRVISAQPKILLRQSEASGTAHSALLFLDGTNFYILRTAPTASGGTDPTWDAGPGGRHPMTMDISDAGTGGNVVFSGNVSAYSDRRLKEDISPIENALSKVEQLNGITYTRKGTSARRAGLVAQEVQKVLPEVVDTDADGYLSVAYGNMVGLLVEAMKEQQQQIAALTARLARLEG